MTDLAVSPTAPTFAPREEERPLAPPAAAPQISAPAPRARTRRRAPVGVALSALVVGFLVLISLFPGQIVPGDPFEGAARDAFLAPSAAHWLGTDENGRDVFVRLVHGARASIVMGVAATVIGLGGGVALGLAAGLGRRLLDGALMRLVDVLLAFPDLLLALVIITFWGQGLMNAIVAVGVASIPRYARLVRAQTAKVKSAPYVEAALTLGIRRSTIIWRHVLPNAIKPVLLLATIGVGGKIAAGASLSFLGFGAPPPSPEWGAMLAVGRNFLSNAPWLVAAPALAITLTVVSITALGRALMRASEGRRP